MVSSVSALHVPSAQSRSTPDIDTVASLKHDTMVLAGQVALVMCFQSLVLTKSRLTRLPTLLQVGYQPCV